MNKRGKKKFIAKHGYKKYHSSYYRYLRLWTVLLKRHSNGFAVLDGFEILGGRPMEDIFHEWKSWLPGEEKIGEGIINGKEING